ncbi:MAG: sulfatase-like hydrolase/transferase, partial [Paludibacteraceae bacterium]|nr:sulfatase-like hydrolase/transferase [Paludibacteraceae bacterium]
IVETVLLAVSAYFVVIGIRGGFGAYTRPITMSNALQYTNTPRESAIVLNTPFTLMRSTEGKAYVNPHYYPDDELDQIMSPVHNEPASHKLMQKRNVVIFILESFSKEYMGSYTPFLDSLSRVSVSYEYSFASGRKSIDAMPSVLSSIPMLIEPYIVTAYSTNAVSSVADCLKRKGYTTAFFHGAPNGSMGFQAYARSAGFAKYYGMDEYDGPEAFDGTWAIWDEEFLQYYGRTMSTMAEPFCTAVFTASSHHPFRIPERYEGRFPKGEVPIHQCIGYSDNALREFFNYAQKQPWYENTLFVLTADHTNQLTRPESQTAKGVYEVPIIFFDPQVNKGKVKDVPVSQTDIMPSILEYLGYDEPYFAFGENALTKDKKHPYAVCYNTNVYQIMSDHLVMIFDGEQIVGIYDYQEDPLLKANRKDEWSERKEVKDMLTYLKAYIQQYISRMIENHLTVQ